MISTDGCYKIYIIELRTEGYRNGKWFTASLDHFGSPPGFTACDECWQRTGVRGTFDEKVGRKGIKWMRKKYPNEEFRLTCVHITQMKVPVEE